VVLLHPLHRRRDRDGKCLARSQDRRCIGSLLEWNISRCWRMNPARRARCTSCKTFSDGQHMGRWRPISPHPVQRGAGNRRAKPTPRGAGHGICQRESARNARARTKAAHERFSTRMVLIDDAGLPRASVNAKASIPGFSIDRTESANCSNYFQHSRTRSGAPSSRDRPRACHH
jgi:hypothetical protein